MEMCPIASKALVPFLISDLQHQLDDALDALAETDRSRPGLVELLVAPNVVAFFGYAGEIVRVCKGKKAEYTDETIVGVKKRETRQRT